MTGPGGRDRRRDPRRKDRSEEMADVLLAAREAFAPLTSALGDMVRSITEGLRPPAPPAAPDVPAAEPPVSEQEPAPKPPRRKRATAKTDSARRKKKKAEPRAEATARKPGNRAPKKGGRTKR